MAIDFAPALMLTAGDAADALPRFFAARGYDAFPPTRRGERAPLRAADFLAPLPPCGDIDVLFARRRAAARP